MRVSHSAPQSLSFCFDFTSLLLTTHSSDSTAWNTAKGFANLNWTVRGSIAVVLPGFTTSENRP